MTEKTDKAGADLPEVGYYTDANGYAWQLTAAEAKKLGYAAADPPPATQAPAPAGPPTA